MGPALRISLAWVVTTALIVLGVNAAVERVARDVSVARPAPMTPGEVDEQLREQRDGTSTTAGTRPEPAGSVSLPPTSEPATSTSTGPATGTTTGPPTGPPTSEPHRPDVTRPDTPGGPPADVGTSTTAAGGPSGRPDEREDGQRP